MENSQLKIYGNDHGVNLIKKMTAAGKEPHSILIYGEKGLGKKTFAKYIAALMMCRDPHDVPCGNCKSCRMIKQGIHPDFIQIKANEKGNYLTDDIREKVVADSIVLPNEGDLKVYLIADIDLSVSTSVQIQNILLKLIEEPPSHSVVILTATSKEIFLPTILSRVISFGMNRVTDSQVGDFLQNEYPDRSSQEIFDAVSAGGGCIGKSCEFLNKGEFFYAANLAGEIAQACIEQNEYKLLKTFAQADGKKSLIRESLRLFSEILRDACIYTIQNNTELLTSCNKKAAQTLSKILSPLACTALYDKLCEYIVRIDSNCSISLTINSLTGQIAKQF